MINDDEVITSLEELEAFILQVEAGGFGLKNASGVALATNNSNGRPFVAVLDDKQQLVLGRWVTQDVFDNGKEIVQYGPRTHH
ncbi:hypothetical protein [Marinomonas epiphytica]